MPFFSCHLFDTFYFSSRHAACQSTGIQKHGGARLSNAFRPLPHTPHRRRDPVIPTVILQDFRCLFRTDLNQLRTYHGNVGLIALQDIVAVAAAEAVFKPFHVVFHQYADGCGSGTGSMSCLQATIDVINSMNIKQLYFFIFVGVIHYIINELLMEKLRGEIIFAVPDKNVIFTPN